jgi:sugar lactone lactonase YvrE
MRFNDGAVDSLGRFWAGSMNDFGAGAPQAEGTVFRLDPDMSVHRMIENVTIPNGIGWSPDDTKMYFTDSPTRRIDVFDFVKETGEIRNRRMFFKLGEEEWDGNVVLDGCAVDIAGNVWTAVHEGACVLKLSPEGTVLAKVELPAWRVTCPAFGREGELFVTTAGVEEGERPPEGTKYHGAVFRVMTGVQGATRNKFGPFETGVGSIDL